MLVPRLHRLLQPFIGPEVLESRQRGFHISNGSTPGRDRFLEQIHTPVFQVQPFFATELKSTVLVYVTHKGTLFRDRGSESNINITDFY